MPMQISYRVDDHGIIQGTKRVHDGLVETTQEELDQAFAEMQYDASGGYIGGSTYELVPSRGYPRTGNYGRSFVRERRGLTYRLTNATYTPKGKEYGVYVGGRADGSGQAWMHQGYWPTIKSAVDKTVAGLAARIIKAVDRLKQANGL